MFVKFLFKKKSALKYYLHNTFINFNVQFEFCHLYVAMYTLQSNDRPLLVHKFLCLGLTPLKRICAVAYISNVFLTWPLGVPALCDAHCRLGLAHPCSEWQTSEFFLFGLILNIISMNVDQWVLGICFISTGWILKSRFSGPYDQSVQLLRNYQTSFPKWLYQFAFPAAA